MKIESVRAILLTGPCSNDPFLKEARQLRSAAFIEIKTDRGMIGVGETYAGYFCPEIVPSVVEFFAPILVGQTLGEGEDPCEWIAELWSRMYLCGNFWCRVGLGAIVLTGIEAALWDLQGKIRNTPVHKLLGGTRTEPLLCYASGGPSNYPKDRLAAKADHYLNLGFRGFKIGAGFVENGEFFCGNRDAAKEIEFECDKIAFLRERYGDEIHILIDGHMDNSPFTPWSYETARDIAKALEPFHLFLLEEPLPYNDAAAYARLAAETTVPIAGGECLTTLCEWRDYIVRDSFDIGQPDASFSGGLLEFLKIARELENRGRKTATHAWGAGASLMQNIHAGFAANNTCILEVPPDYGPLHSRLIGDSLQIQDGCVIPPAAPGLGIELSEETKNAFPFIPGSGEFNSVPGKKLTT